MKLLKFNLIFIPFLALCLGVVGYIARTVLLDESDGRVLALIRRQTISTKVQRTAPLPQRLIEPSLPRPSLR
jgi:hypothetical protein